MAQQLFPDINAVAGLCRRYHIRRLSLFGSTLKGAARPDSDVDLLVEFEPDAKPSLVTMAEIELELSPLLGGAEGGSPYGPGFEPLFPGGSRADGRGAI